MVITVLTRTQCALQKRLVRELGGQGFLWLLIYSAVMIINQLLGRTSGTATALGVVVGL